MIETEAQLAPLLRFLNEQEAMVLAIDTEFVRTRTYYAQLGLLQIFDGQQWLHRFLTHNPELAPAIHRDLLWFFGGDCLHFMPDEEIEKLLPWNVDMAVTDGLMSERSN